MCVAIKKLYLISYSIVTLPFALLLIGLMPVIFNIMDLIDDITFWFELKRL